MIIKQLILYKFIRLSLNNIEYLEYAPENKIQLILGTNGSGKSSLLSELSPLPGNKDFYHKEGYKLITIEHRNALYVLKSSFETSGNRFSFKKDDEELNPGGTITVYKELVRQHFNVTQDVHDLLTGVTTFHSMSVAERRSWLTKISDSDYTYAFKYYNALRDQLRDIQGSIKISQSRLVQESDKLLTPEQESAYRMEILELKRLISALLESKQPLIDRTALRAQLNTLESTIRDAAKLLTDHGRQMRHCELNSVSEIEAALIEIKSNLLRYQEQSLSTFNQIQQLKEQFQALQHASVDSLSDTDHQIDQYVDDVQVLKNQKQLGFSFICPTTTLQAIATIKEQLTQILTELPVNTDAAYGRERYNALIEQYQQVSAVLRRKDKDQLQLIAIRQDMEHQRDHQQTTCPQCRHVWSQGYDHTTYQRVVGDIDATAQELSALQTQSNNLEIALEAQKGYSELFRQYRDLSRHWSILDPLWAYMAAESVLYQRPQHGIQLLDQLSADLAIDAQINSLNHRIEELLTVKAMLVNNQELDLTKCQDHIAALEKELYAVGELIRETKVQETKYVQYRTALIAVHRWSSELEGLLATRSTKTDELLASVKQDALNETIRLLQMELNQKESLISKIDIQKAVIESIEQSIAELSERQELLKIAVKELSPTEGLIAKGLTSFINSFVQQVNAFIAKIWLYPLELIPILPDADDEVDLDYKFSVRINDNITINDVSKGSSAMREVIDLAFRVTSCVYLNMTDFPLILDELGVAFDKAHRQSVYYMVSQLMTTSSFSQIFLVSHYESFYGSLTNADISILSASNIDIPSNTAFNKHLIMR